MAAEILTIADAVATALNNGSLSLPFTAIRELIPRTEVKDLQGIGGVVVRVVPRSVTAARKDRGRSQYDYKIDIGLQVAVVNQVNTTTTYTADQVFQLAQEAAQLLRDNRLADFPTAVCTETAIDPVYAPEHLSELGVITTVISASYTVLR